MTSLARTAILLAAASLALPAAAAPRIAGLERPAAVVTWKLPHAQRGRPDRPAVRTCQVFTRWAVLSTDEGEVGVDDLELRARQPGPSPTRACADGFAGRTVRPRLDEVLEPVGLFRRWLVAESPDTFGAFASFWLIDLESGRVAYADEYDHGRGIRLRPDGAEVELEYWARLDGFLCVPHSGKAGCWPRVREQLHLPPTVPAPDCERIMARHPEYASWPEGRLDPEQIVQLSAHVRVRGLQRERAEYLPERPRCSETP